LAALADGLGWLLGDQGSGFWIGRQTVVAALADLDGRGPATGLTELVLTQLELPHSRRLGEFGRPAVIDQVLRLVYADRPVALSGFARLVFELTADPVACRIRQLAGDRLATSLRSLIDRSVVGPVVVAGSVLVRHLELIEQVKHSCVLDFAQPPDYRLVHDGVVGAVVLALRQLGLTVDQVVFERISASLADLPSRRARLGGRA
jgi:N-acetylglucosamine kinase-like BadF-type ATPase